jgi:hypothetical protein
MQAVEIEQEPKDGLKRGTPEGDKLIRVRVMKPCTYGTTIDLERRYEVGEELTIPAWRFTSWHNPKVILGKDGRPVMTVRGTFELASRVRPQDDNVGKHSATQEALINENADLRKRLAILESGAIPGKGSAKKSEI